MGTTRFGRVVCIVFVILWLTMLAMFVWSLLHPDQVIN